MRSFIRVLLAVPFFACPAVAQEYKFPWLLYVEGEDVLGCLDIPEPPCTRLKVSTLESCQMENGWKEPDATFQEFQDFLGGEEMRNSGFVLMADVSVFLCKNAILEGGYKTSQFCLDFDFDGADDICVQANTL